MLTVGKVGLGPLADGIASVLGNEGEDVGTNVPSAKSVKSPIGFDSGDLRVV